MILAAIAASCLLTSCDFLSFNNYGKAGKPADTTQKAHVEEIDPSEIEPTSKDSLIKSELEKVSEEIDSDAPAAK
ncbi:hypothetical protein MYP_2170 [Sporocytophaga myxococcoides]|uniref:Lipoprotein n=2 Tax=Sporocytophaga myxococcoides TaxID=153721 RepID=A0A098LET2_9BACT|nr:hypothetical protein MYP_2170 [Sporocytophaga myxococcoides]